jgi:peptidoglycan lytic transglycosylase
MTGATRSALRASACALAIGFAAPAFALTQCGEASWYNHAGRPTASGGTVDPATLTAAHRTLSFGSRVTVENLDNGKSVVVIIDDRGPFTDGRIIDVSRAAAETLDIIHDGVAQVRISTVQTTVKLASAKDCRPDATGGDQP